MNDTQIKTLEQVRQFLDGTGAIDLVIETMKERYDWIRDTLIRFRYRHLGKADKGLLLDFLQKVSGYSRIQVKRLVKQYLKTGRLQRRQRTAKGFSRKYTLEDIRLLARTDEHLLDDLRARNDVDFWTVVAHLANAGHITPIATSGINSPTTSFRTCCLSAPRAIRMPIS